MILGVFGLGLLMIISRSMTMLEYTYFSRYIMCLTMNIDVAIGIYATIVTTDTDIREKLHSLEDHVRITNPEPIDPSEITFDSLKYTYEDGVVGVHLNSPLTLRRGEILAITGESGMGKTRFTEILTEKVRLAGLECVLRSGKAGADSCRDGAASVSLSMITQSFEQEAREQVPKVGTSVRRWLAPDSGLQTLQCGIDSPISEILSELGLSKRVKLDGEIPEKLSGGERARLVLARFLPRITSPIVVFDEVESGLDAGDITTIINVIRGRLFDKTVVMVTHNAITIDAADHCVKAVEGELTIVK